MNYISCKEKKIIRRIKLNYLSMLRILSIKYTLYIYMYINVFYLLFLTEIAKLNAQLLFYYIFIGFIIY